MDQNPYAPPRAAGGPPMPLGAISPDQELQVMREIGKRRSRMFSLALVVSWPAILAILMLVFRLGLVPGGIASGALAGGFARFLVKSRKEAIIRAVLNQLGIPAGLMDPAKYLID